MIPASEHKIDPARISSAALKTMQHLSDKGYNAYLVGGGVRDLLLDDKPKDFDVATNATPEQVRQLFKNSRIIGRRFKIVHVRYGREIIEVTTFRGTHDDSNSDKQSRQSNTGMLLRDNVYGSLEEDAVRRDFTINALYYDGEDHSVQDFVGGVDDIQARTIRIIGDAETRYREDPVRMLRAVRFAAKLGFTIDKDTEQPIAKLSKLLSHVAAARMFDEVIKLLMSGHGLATFELMQKYDLFEPLFPAAQWHLGQDESALELLRKGLINTDARLAEDKRVTPAFLYAVILWPEVKAQTEQLESEGVPQIPALHQAAQMALAEQQQTVAIPKRFSLTMRDIWELQYRLPRNHGKRALELLGHRYFRAAYDFLLLREEAGEISPGLGEWWTDFQKANPDVPRQSRSDSEIQAERDAKPKRNRNRRRRPRRGQGQGGNGNTGNK